MSGASRYRIALGHGVRAARPLALLPALLAVGCAATPRGDDDSAPAVDDDDSTVAWDPSALPEADAPVRSPLNGTVTHIVDGDTFDVDLVDAGSRRVRVLAIDTTEMNVNEPYGPDCWAQEAKDRAAELLPLGTDVWLTFDGQEEDVYGRLLAYVFVGRAPTEVSFQDSFNYRMVREGYAYTFFFDNNRSFEDILRAAEHQAEADGTGVWACD